MRKAINLVGYNRNNRRLYQLSMTSTSEIKRQFFNSLKCGTGEAYLLMKRYPKIDFSNHIIKGVLKNYAYDGQCEGSSAQYIYELISLSKQQDKIRKAVLHGLANEKKDTWNLTHLLELAKFYAERGDAEMKDAIYSRFLNNPIEGSDWAGSSEILELDGLQGMIYIAEKFGKQLEQDPDGWQDDSILVEFQEKNPEIKVYEELKKEARTNKYIRIYLKEIKRVDNKREKYLAKRPPNGDLIEDLCRPKYWGLFFRIKKLNTEEVLKVAEVLVKETDKFKIERLLYVFYHHPFPLDKQIILDYASQKKSRKNKIAENAIDALRHLKGKSIREFALHNIQTSKNPIDYLQILISNYKPGDHKLLSAIAGQAKGEHKVEQLAIAYTNIYEANKTKECKKPLEILYDKMNCAIHRRNAIEILLANGVLSNKIRKEIQYDCDLRTRKLV